MVSCNSGKFAVVEECNGRKLLIFPIHELRRRLTPKGPQLQAVVEGVTKDVNVRFTGELRDALRQLNRLQLEVFSETQKSHTRFPSLAAYESSTSGKGKIEKNEKREEEIKSKQEPETQLLIFSESSTSEEFEIEQNEKREGKMKSKQEPGLLIFPESSSSDGGTVVDNEKHEEVKSTPEPETVLLFPPESSTSGEGKIEKNEKREEEIKSKQGPETQLLIFSESSSSKEAHVDENEQQEDTNTSEHEANRKPGQTKKYSCLYCEKLVSRLPDHLECRHSNEENVKNFMRLPRNSRERAKLINRIRGAAAIKFNESQEDDGELQIGRRTGQPADRILYVPCLQCGNYFKKKNMANHYRKCAQKRPPRDLLSQCRRRVVSLKAPHNVIMSPQLAQIISVMSGPPEIIKIIESDPTIIIYGNRLCAKNSHIINTQSNTIRRSLRMMATILLYMYDNDDDVEKKMEVAYYYKHEKFQIFKKAVLNHVGYNAKQYKAPSQVGAIGRIWLDCTKSLSDMYLDQGMSEEKMQLDNWLSKYRFQFYEQLEKPATLYLEKQSWGKKMEIPTDEDVFNLCTHLDHLMKEHASHLTQNFSSFHWGELNKSVIVFLTVFNRKRSGEVEGTSVEQFEKRVSFTNLSGNWSHHLTENDQIQLKKYDRMLVKGKRSKGVSVLMEAGIVKHINLILQYRNAANIPSTNPYLFAFEESYFRCSMALSTFADQCGAHNPCLLTTTKLRKHFATSVPMLKLDNNELTTVTQFLGHDERTEALHYRMPDAVTEMAHLSTILEASASQSLPTLKGRTLGGVNNQNFTHIPLPGPSSQIGIAEPSKVTSEPPLSPNHTVMYSSSDSDEVNFITARKCLFSDSEPNEPKTRKLADATPYPATETPPTDVLLQTPPQKVPKRRKQWTPRQTEVIEDNFKQYLDAKAIPPAHLIRKVLTDNRDILCLRTESNIRTHISNINLGKTKRLLRKKKTKD